MAAYAPAPKPPSVLPLPSLSLLLLLLPPDAAPTSASALPGVLDADEAEVVVEEGVFGFGVVVVAVVVVRFDVVVVVVVDAIQLPSTGDVWYPGSQRSQRVPSKQRAQRGPHDRQMRAVLSS